MKRFSEPSSSSSSSQSPDSKRQRCSEDSDSASDSESESDAGGCHKGRSELLLTHLSMFPGEELQEDSKAAHNGKSKERIKKLLKEPFCKCKKNATKLWTLLWSSNCAWLFGAWQKQPKIVFFGVSRTWQQTTSWKMRATQVPIQTHLLLGPSLKILLGKAPKQSNWTVGTFKAGHWLAAVSCFLIHRTTMYKA